MRVFAAETGLLLPARSFSAGEGLDELHREIETLTSVPPKAQILLTDKGAQCKQDFIAKAFSDGLGQATGVAEADMTANELVIFVFNRLVLDPRASISGITRNSVEIEPPVPLEVLQIMATETERQGWTIAEQKEGFLASFRSHLSYSVAISKTARNHLKACEKVLQEQRVQVQALSVALTNLEGHSRSVCEAFESFNSHSQKELTKHSSLLKSFPADLQALHRIPVHTAIAEDHKFLSDYVPEDKLLTWVESCRAAHEQLVRKSVGLADTVRSIKMGTDSEVSQLINIDFEKLGVLVNGVAERVQKIDARRQLFERDFSRVEASLRDAERSPLQASERFQALDHLFDIHREEYLQDVTKHDGEIRDAITYLCRSRTNLAHVLISRLQTISNLQSSIATVMPLLTTLSGTLNSHSQAFGQLLHVHRMPPAWGATLVEIVRRKEYVKVFISRAREMAEVLAKYRTQEERRRENFKNEIIRYIPVGLVTGLDDRPPYCEISVSNTKDTLPEVTRDDIADFEKLVANLRSAMSEVDNSSSVGTGTTAGNSPGGPSDSISKLQATMLKMSSQVEGMATEFDKILLKSSLCSRIEEENTRLRSELAQMNRNVFGSAAGPLPATSPSSIRKQAGGRAISMGSLENGSEGSAAKAEETIRAYEGRIRSLEKLLQQSYNMSASKVASQDEVNALKATINSLQTENKELQNRLYAADSQAVEAETRLKEVSIAGDQRLREALSTARDQESELEGLKHQLFTLQSDFDRQLRASGDDRSRLQSRCLALEREVADLKSSLSTITKEKGVLLSELDRIAGFVREVYTLLDSCSKAISNQDSGNNDPTGITSPISTSLPTNFPSSGPVSVPNYRHSFSNANTPPTPLPEAPSPPLQSPSPRTPSGSLALGIPILGSLRSDEKEIRRRLRELEDDIRCQTLEMIDLQREVRILRMPPMMEQSEGGDYDYRDGGSSVGASGSIGLRMEDQGQSRLDGTEIPLSTGENLSGLIDETKRLAGIIAELSSQIGNLQGALEKTREELTSVEVRAGIAEKGLDDVRALLNTKEEELLDAMEACRKYQKELTALDVAKKEIQETAEIERREKEDALSQITLLQDDVAMLKDQAAAAAETVTSLSDEVTDKTALLAKSEAEVQSEMARAKALLEPLEDWQVVYRLALEQIGFKEVASNALSDVKGKAAQVSSDESTEETKDSVLSPLQFFGNRIQGDLELDGLSYMHTDLDSSPSSRLFGSSLGVGSGDIGEAESRRFVDAVKEAYGKVAGVGEVLDIADWTAKAIDIVGELRERYSALIEVHRNNLKLSKKITFHGFHVNDLALFLPTRNPKAWPPLTSTLRTFSSPLKAASNSQRKFVTVTGFSQTLSVLTPASLCRGYRVESVWTCRWDQILLV
ncbi:hypothetical protein BC829DRAFT_430285 [Chytridium lagenaria]|nr:hypothetical protein BC829DRAFT_430285 [Chytridium lagenaria]